MKIATKINQRVSSNLRAITNINTTTNIITGKMQTTTLLQMVVKEITRLKKIKPRKNQNYQHARLMDQTELQESIA